MDIKKSYLSIIKAFPGGWDAMTGALGMTRNALENRIYEKKGQGVEVELALTMQSFAGTTHFAEAVAIQSGGVFLKLPADLDHRNVDLGKKWRELNVRLGELAVTFDTAIEGDEEIDAKERRELEAVAADMHRTIAEWLALSFRVYCKPDERSE